jgi:pyruvate kinase
MTGRAGHAWQRTKIVCTLGPAIDVPGVLEALVRNGMDVARIKVKVLRV